VEQVEQGAYPLPGFFASLWLVGAERKEFCHIRLTLEAFEHYQLPTGGTEPPLPAGLGPFTMGW